MNGVDMIYEEKKVKYLELYLEPFTNAFKSETYQEAPLPKYKRSLLPEPVYDANPDFVELYYKSFELAFNNFRQPTFQNGFIKNYIDTAFNDSIFMWDSVFMAMYGKYVSNVFNFQETLDNFYVTQEPDGFIGREIIRETGMNKYHRFDPVSTGPNILAFAEWQYYEYSSELTRLKKVYPVILKYHEWLKRYRTFKDGSYWYTGWSCGMDNQLRVSEEVYDYSYHDNQSWLDANLHQIISCKYLIKMTEVLGEQIPQAISEEQDKLTRLVNEKMWDDETGFYYDLKKDDTLGSVRSIGAYWAFHADLMTREQEQSLLDKLFDPKWFGTPYPFASMAASDPNYDPMGNYWRGGVWAPTNYMVLTGTYRKLPYAKLAASALKHLDQIHSVYKETGTVWENYSPEYAKNGSPSKPNFMGWTGLSTIATFIEFVIGIKMDTITKTVRWDLNSTERCGVKNLVFADEGTVSLVAEARQDKEAVPQITMVTDVADINLEVYVDDRKVKYERVIK